jgi:hypothetical protein
MRGAAVMAGMVPGDGIGTPGLGAGTKLGGPLRSC